MKTEKKSNNNNKYFFTFTFSYKKFIFCSKKYLEKLRLYCYICITVFPRARLMETKCNNKALDAVLRPKILGNKVGILT